MSYTKQTVKENVDNLCAANKSNDGEATSMDKTDVHKWN